MLLQGWGGWRYLEPQGVFFLNGAVGFSAESGIHLTVDPEVLTGTLD